MALTPIEVRFENGYTPEPTTGCWLWFRHADRKWYGRIFDATHGGNRYAHRVSYEIHRDPIPEGMCVCHKCDTPACVNPGHLFVGTKKDNTQDMVRKGRTNSRQMAEIMRRRIANGWRGEGVPTSKLTDAQVLEIRERVARDEPRREVAATFGVTLSLVSQIVNGKVWTHLPVLGRGLDGRRYGARRAARTKLTTEKAREIRIRLAAGERGYAIAEAFGISFALVSAVRRNIIWQEPEAHP